MIAMLTVVTTATLDTFSRRQAQLSCDLGTFRTTMIWKSGEICLKRYDDFVA